MRRPGSFPLAYAVLRRHQVHSLTKQDKGPLLMPSVVISLPNPGWRLMGEREGLQTEAASFLQRTSPKNTPLPRGCGVEPVSGEGPQSAGFLTVEGEVCLSHFFNSHSGKHFHCPITNNSSADLGAFLLPASSVSLSLKCPAHLLTPPAAAAHTLCGISHVCSLITRFPLLTSTRLSMQLPRPTGFPGTSVPGRVDQLAGLCSIRKMKGESIQRDKQEFPHG